jgi:hypothetical protein
MRTKMQLLVLSLVLPALLLAPTASRAQDPPTDEEIQASIDLGLEWLAAQQNADGSWGTYEQVAQTCFALIKLQDRAWELGYDSPFDMAYLYSGEVIAGWGFVLDPVNYTFAETLSIQVHGANNDDPDTNGNGFGVYFDTEPLSGHHRVYTTGVCAMALSSSDPDRPNDGGLDFDGDTVVDTYFELGQETADWLAFAQGDLELDEGGWGYWSIDNDGGPGIWTDNSVTGYATLGIAALTGFGCDVPDWVARELEVWIGTIQDPVTGGSYYNPDWLPGDPWLNLLKTGNLIFEMTYVGDDPTTARFELAMDYILDTWQSPTLDPGWGFSLNPAAYQAVFALMKGFEFSLIDLIDLDGDTVPEHDWYAEFATVLLDQQNADGSWPTCYWGSQELCTVWALLTLEKISPPPPAVEFNWDLKFCSNPNAFNCRRATGVVPMLIFGTGELDVTEIDPATLMLALASDPASYISPPAHYLLEPDLGSPGDVGPSSCYWSDDVGDEVANPDGYLDFAVYFRARDVADLIGCSGLGKGDTSPELVLLGQLYDGRDLVPLNTQVLDIKR